MITSVFYVLLAIFGLSFLIFVHELGHYFMARRVGMRVETFAIGFGKPIYSWERKGVKWQIGWLLFGGYVKIAGQDEETQNPYEIPDSFFGRPPIDRIKVSFMGPLVNLVAAFLIFMVLWLAGGREKNFSEFTHKIGWVDPQSKLYAEGIRPGDEIAAYNRHPYQTVKDHLYAPMISSGDIDVEGFKLNYAQSSKYPFEYKISPYPHPFAVEKGFLTSGIISPASYVISAQQAEGSADGLPEGSPMLHSGIKSGDRIVWLDGNVVFSALEMNRLLNDGKALLTVERNGEILLMRVPRVPVFELKIDSEFKEELTDWQYEANLDTKLPNMLVIPYNLDNHAVVENELKFIDKENQIEAFPPIPFSGNEHSLLPKDKIIAVDGTPISTSYELLAHLQQHRIVIIVERNSTTKGATPWREADANFDKEMQWNDLSKITNSIGLSHPVTTAGDYVLLNPVIPKAQADFALSAEKKAWLAAELLEQKKEVEKIEDPEKRHQALAKFKNQEKQLLLGLPIQDLKVNYNPTPWEQFKTVFDEIWLTLTALFTGSLNPKWMSGPIGIVQVVHDNWMIGIKEALFWLGAISLNLGILNLLPIPVLDGGKIVLSFFEMVTGKKIQPKTMEKLILPFAVLLIVFFIFVTYQDLSRIFTGLMR